MENTYDPTAHDQLQAKVKELAKELPGITLGYIGNMENWGDDRAWYVFLPHPGRVGTHADRVTIGTFATTAELPVALAIWDEMVPVIRRKYHEGGPR